MIYHAFRDPTDPAWEGWDVVDEDGKRWTATTLAELRACGYALWHHGPHPDRSRRPPDNAEWPTFYVVYWCEKQ